MHHDYDVSTSLAVKHYLSLLMSCFMITSASRMVKSTWTMTGSCSLSSLEEMTSVIGELCGLIQNFVHRSSKLEEEGYLLPTIARKITLPTFRLNAPVVIRSKHRQNYFPSYSW